MENEINKYQNFKVKEWALLDFLVGGFFFILFIFSIATYKDDYTSYQYNIYIKSVYIVLIPAIIFTLKGFNKRTIILVNNKGIYYYGQFITDWNNFNKAYLTQDNYSGDIKDDFVLVINYYNTEEGENYERRIPLTNTQDKSEEEILDAINFYSDLQSKSNTGQN
ncbi:MAG: hypothetical protein ACJ748_15965 [Flavisolibacter sp.]